MSKKKRPNTSSEFETYNGEKSDNFMIVFVIVFCCVMLGLIGL